MDKQKLTKWGAIAMTVVILVAIYSQIDLRALAGVFVNIHPWYFALAMSVFLLQFFVTALRWRVMLVGIHPMTVWGAFKMVMAGKALNAIAPSKLGEMSKAYFLKKEGATELAPALSAVVLEKVLDMAGLCAVLLIGAIFWRDTGNPTWWVAMLIGAGFILATAVLLVVPLEPLGRLFTRLHPKLEKVAKLLRGWDDVLRRWKEHPAAFVSILLLSVLLWSVHVLQLYLFFPSLRQTVPVAFTVANIPLAIFVGLLPLTFAGMGTRDAAFIFLFSPYASAAAMAGVGLLASMRYWVDTLVGIPFFHLYASKSAGAKTQGPGGGARPLGSE